MHVRFSQCVWIVVKWFVVNNICRADMLSWYKQNCLVIGFILHRHEMFLSQLPWPSFEKGLESGGLPSFCQSPILPGTLHYTEVKPSLSLSLSLHLVLALLLHEHEQTRALQWKGGGTIARTDCVTKQNKVSLTCESRWCWCRRSH